MCSPTDIVLYLPKIKKKTVKKSEIWVKFFAFYRVGDWYDSQIDLHVILHVGFKMQFAGIVPVFLDSLPAAEDRMIHLTGQEWTSSLLYSPTMQC